MAPDRVRTLLDNGYLWNSSGLAEYFFDLYSRPDFQAAVRAERSPVHPQLPPVLRARWPRSRAARLSDQANFALVELRGRPQRRGPRLALARPPRDLHPDLRRQEGARPRQVRADRRPQPPRERLHHSLPSPHDGISRKRRPPVPPRKHRSAKAEIPSFRGFSYARML